MFFWPLAGLSKTKQLSESEFDVRATLRLNKLYTTLRADNSEWGTPERSADMNHFMARLIFLFFAEDTDILNGEDLFTATIEQMSNADGSNTHEVSGEYDYSKEEAGDFQSNSGLISKGNTASENREKMAAMLFGAAPHEVTHMYCR